MDFILAHIGLSLSLLLMACFILWFTFSCFVVVGGAEICLLERRWFGKDLTVGRVIAQASEVGVQARTLGPGVHFLVPLLYITTKVPFTKIGENQIGLIESIDGDPVKPGRIFADLIDCNSFQDGEEFLFKGGQKGPQIPTLPPGVYKINPKLFKVSLIENQVIPEGMIGVIIAQDGAPIPTGRLLGGRVDAHNNFQSGQAFITNGGQKGPQLDVLLPGIYRINTKLFTVKTAKAAVINSGNVGIIDALDGDPLPENEYVAKSVPGHRDFQDGAMFLKSGGQRGPQLDVLRPGIYYVNPFMFGIMSVPVTEVQRGQVAVIVSNIGMEPDTKIKERLSSQTGDAPPADPSKETYVMPKGYRGIQEDVRGPGRYYLNTRAFIPYIIDTTNQTIDWDDKDSNGQFDPLSVVSKDGFNILVSVKVVVRVRPDQAPYMVAKVGSMENLINHVIHPMIDSSFRNQASTTEAMSFMQDRKEEQQKAEEYVHGELAKYHVECVSVLICQIILPQELMDTQTKKIIAEQQVPQYEAQQKSEAGRISVEKTRATASAQNNIVNAEISVEVAKQKKMEQVTLAEAEAQSTELKGKGQAASISAVGEAQALAYQKQQAAVGPTNLTILKVVEQLKEGNLKLVPDILTIGGSTEGGLSGILTKLIASNTLIDKTPVNKTK